MTPLEAAILAISQDAATMLRVALQIQEQGKTLETAARALASGLAEVKRASGLMTSIVDTPEEEPHFPAGTE